MSSDENNSRELLSFSKKQIPIVITLLLGVASLLGVLYFTQPPKNIADCSEIPLTEINTTVVSVTDNGFSENNLTVQQCNSVILSNDSSNEVKLAFGEHDSHVTYPGFEEVVVVPGEIATITLYQAGDFELHNHNNESNVIPVNVEMNESVSQYRSVEDAIPYKGSGNADGKENNKNE